MRRVADSSLDRKKVDGMPLCPGGRDFIQTVWCWLIFMVGPTPLIPLLLNEVTKGKRNV